MPPTMNDTRRCPLAVAITVARQRHPVEPTAATASPRVIPHAQSGPPGRCGLPQIQRSIMKKISFALATATATLLCGGAHAAGLIAGVAVGQAHLSVDCTGATECKVNTTGVKLMGGYKWVYGLAVEVSYFDFGKFS